MSKRFILAMTIVVLLAGLAGCIKSEPVEVDVTAAKETDGSGYLHVDFTYNFNQDVTLDSVHVMIPWVVSPFIPQGQTGDVEGDTDNNFKVYWLDGEEYVIPSGTWTVYFWGVSIKGEEEFELSKTFNF
jgi:hypothetical protein